MNASASPADETVPVPAAPPRSRGRKGAEKEAAFWNELETEIGPRDAGRAWGFFQALTGPDDLCLEYGPRSVVLKMPPPTGDDRKAKVSFVTLHPTGGLNSSGHFCGTQRDRGIPQDVADRIAYQFWASLHAVDVRFSPTAEVTQHRPQKFVPFAEIGDRLPALSRCIGKAADDVRAAFAGAGAAPSA